MYFHEQFINPLSNSNGHFGLLSPPPSSPPLAWGYQMLYSTVHGRMYTQLNSMIDGIAGIQYIHTNYLPATDHGWLPMVAATRPENHFY
jgi:hypothetical protein